ncbi:MAG: hypothetical protein WCB67_16765 [Solirubrobacteraceae bacterium]
MVGSSSTVTTVIDRLRSPPFLRSGDFLSIIPPDEHTFRAAGVRECASDSERYVCPQTWPGLAPEFVTS